jgi:hypothetical protein
MLKAADQSPDELNVFSDGMLGNFVAKMTLRRHPTAKIASASSLPLADYA